MAIAGSSCSGRAGTNISIGVITHASGSLGVRRVVSGVCTLGLCVCLNVCAVKKRLDLSVPKSVDL